MSRRVFAVASEDDFYNILRKGQVEGLDLGSVLGILVHIYATTDMALALYKDYKPELQDNPTRRQ